MCARLLVVLLPILTNGAVGAQEMSPEESKDSAIVTIENLADWPNSDDHWSDIPGWPEDKWGKWGKEEVDEGGQPTKRKVESQAHPNSETPGGFYGSNPQQTYQGRPFPGQSSQPLHGSGHGIYHPYHQTQVPEVRQNPYATNKQAVNPPRQNSNLGFFQSKNIPQYQNTPKIQAKEISESSKPDFSIKPPNFSGNGFFGENIPGTPATSSGNYQKINFPNHRKQISKPSFRGQNMHHDKNEIDQNQTKNRFSKPNPFLDNSDTPFKNPFQGFNRNTNQGQNKQQPKEDGFHSTNSFNPPPRNFLGSNGPNKGRANFGFRAPPSNILGIDQIRIAPPNFKPRAPFQGQRGPVFNAKNNFKRRAPGRFRPAINPVPQAPAVGNPFEGEDFSDFEEPNIDEINDKDFMKDFGKFSSEGSNEEKNNVDNNGEYKDDFFTDPEMEQFDFSDFDEFESFDYGQEISGKSNPSIKAPLKKEENKDDLKNIIPTSFSNNQLKRESYAKGNIFPRSKVEPESTQDTIQKHLGRPRHPEKSKNKDDDLDFNYSTEGLEMFKHSKHRKPTYKDPYRKPDSKYSLKRPEYDPEKDFEPLFDFGNPESGFGPEFTGAEFNFGIDDETAEQARTSHQQNDYQQDYDKPEAFQDNYEEKGEGFKKDSAYFSDTGPTDFGNEFDQDKEYLDKVFSEFKDKYEDIDKNAKNRRISQNNEDDESKKKLKEKPEMITDPFEQTDIDKNKERSDKYDYVHEKLLTDDHWQRMNMIPASARDNTKDEADYDNFSFSKKKGKEFVDDRKMATNGGWIPMTKTSLDVS